MLRLLTDEDFDRHIVRAALHRLPALDLVRAQEAGLMATPDPLVLEWASRERRILLTHDVNTMLGHAFERVRRGELMPGVLVVHQRAPYASVVEDLLILSQCSEPEEWVNRVSYLPL
jgi:hypothetical protein